MTTSSATTTTVRKHVATVTATPACITTNAAIDQPKQIDQSYSSGSTKVGPCKSANGISTESAVFAQLTCASDTQIERPHCDMFSKDLHLQTACNR